MNQERTPEVTVDAADAPVESPEAKAAKQAKIERKSRLLGWLIYWVARLIGITLRIHCENMEKLLPAEGGAILVTWHGRTLIPANLLRNRGYWALISLSRDGEMQKNIFERFGFQIIRGSTGRGGIKGALQMARKVKEGGILTFTPDGPRGPTHKVQLGVILMAEKSGAPIVPVGISANRRRLIRSWDSYMIPWPFARCYFLVGEPIYVPPGLNDAQREEIAVQLEVALNRQEREAEKRAGFPDYPAEWRVE
jgi:lysophospholipid acyltransferase (LPLAT)-like uncharacterized protein